MRAPGSSPILNCPVRKELVEQWSEATREFSKAVDALKEHLNGTRFTHMLRLTQEARLKADNARLKLEMHCAEHGC